MRRNGRVILTVTASVMAIATVSSGLLGQLPGDGGPADGSQTSVAEPAGATASRAGQGPAAATTADPGASAAVPTPATSPSVAAPGGSGTAVLDARSAATAAPPTAKPSAAAPSTAKPSTAKPSTAKPSTVKPPVAAPVAPQPSPVKPSTPTPSASPVAPAAPSLPAGSWLSGASGPGIVTGEFAAWRGRDVDIAGTWSDNNTAMVNVWQLQRGAEYGSWQKPMDVAIGAIGPGETWSQARQGAYDARWRQSLTVLENAWAGRSGTLYIRFAHESNSNWYPWSVDASEREDFVQAWRRFRALQEEVFPDAQLVFCVNRESVGTGFDWRQSFPGAQYVDVMAVDYYNQYPFAADDRTWRESVNQTDQYGAPKGLQQHLDFARSVGLPLAVPEWSSVADHGDSAVYIQRMHQFFTEHAGGGAGQLLYEILFDVDNADYKGNFQLMGNSRLPRSAAAYQQAF